MTHSKEELQGMSGKGLVKVFNELAKLKKPIKTFKTKADGVTRILKLQAYEGRQADQKDKQRSEQHSGLIEDNVHLTNAKFAEHPKFRKRCIDANTQPTIRQASKFRNRRGLAYSS